MSKKCINNKEIKTIPNAKKKIIIMIISISIMVFSILQVYNLIRYTFGLEVSKSDMAIYNWVLKLVTYEETDNKNLDYSEAN